MKPKETMKLKWEKNSRVMDLENQGKIDFEDVIERTQTDKFPFEAATVRMHKVREKKPFVTIHIRGNGTQSKWGGYYGTTCRINLGGPYNGGMCPNGDLHESLSWLDVHNVVEEVKETLTYAGIE